MKSDCPLSCPPTGQFYSIYEHYDYTYISCGIILIIASIFLFVGMGINYRLLAKEKKEEEKKEREEQKEERTAMLAPPSPTKSENSAPAAFTPEDVAKMDEDTV